MKKKTLLLLTLLMLFCLSSCATVKKGEVLSQDRAYVQAVELYKPERAYYEGDIHAFLEENEPVAVLKSEDLTSFLDTFCKLEFEKETVLFPIPMDGGYTYDGYIVAVIYSDGGYDIIAEGGAYSCSIGSDGQARYKFDHSDYCGEMPWTEVIEKFT